MWDLQDTFSRRVHIQFEYVSNINRWFDSNGMIDQTNNKSR